MTFKEKFKKEGFSNCDYLEQVADEFAIEFAEWCLENLMFMQFKIKQRETKQLLEIYKKEKGL
jgi:hypothetical protein